MEKQQTTHKVGKRKSSIARVYIKPRANEEGKIEINGETFEAYFPRPTSRMMIMQALEMTQSVGRYDISVNVRGGGKSGQAGAVRHAISRSLITIDPALRAVLKKAGFLTRDAREVERKKYGLSGARRRYQYSKR